MADTNKNQPRQFVTVEKVQIRERGWAESIINKIIWGNAEVYYDTKIKDNSNEHDY